MATLPASLITDKVKTAQAQKRAAGAAAQVPTVGLAQHLGIDLGPGTRVLDLVTGEQGVIIAATVTHRIVPASQ